VQAFLPVPPFTHTTNNQAKLSAEERAQRTRIRSSLPIDSMTEAFALRLWLIALTSSSPRFACTILPPNGSTTELKSSTGFQY